MDSESLSSDREIRIPFYKHPFLNDLRKKIALKLFRHCTLEDIKRCNLYETRIAKFDIPDFILHKLKDFMAATDKMFKGGDSLGLKMGNMNCNLFINDYLYSVLGDES